MLDFYGELNKEAARLQSKESMLGKGLMQPFVSNNSGSRKIMFGVQLEHSLPLLNPEPPIIQTGYEIRFGDRSSSIIKAESDYRVLAKIPKFSASPDHHYYLLLLNENKGVVDVIERISYTYTTETYGYLYNNQMLDNLEIGYEVPKNEILRRSTAFDTHMNRCDGTNLIVGYINDNKTTEDGIKISKSAAKKLAAPLIRKVQVPVNENDILLNLFGDDEHYKSFPDINEELTENILCAVRREKTEECFFAQSIDRLKDILMSDEKYTITGRVIDMNIYCNSPEVLKEKYSNSQLLYYYNDYLRFNEEFVNAVNMLRDSNGKLNMTYKLQKMYKRCCQVLNGDQFVRDKPKPFKGSIIEFIVREDNIPMKGDKITNRYGGKGVISKIVEDEEMPMLDNGKRIEVCFNGSTCVNRLNKGQLDEQSLNFISARLLEYIDATKMSTNEAIDLVYRYLKHVSEAEAEAFYAMMWDDNTTDIDRTWYIDQLVEDGFIYLSNKPITESMTLDQLNAIYKEFPFIKQYDIMTSIKDSNGNLRQIPGRRPLVCGKMYIYRLKQYAEEKFSVTSLSATNIRNENTRSKANKNYRILHANTPIQFGNMEIEHMADHMGVEAVVEALMVHSVSPQGRRLYEAALTGDPYNVNIVLDENSKNRKAEILNAYLKAMGLKIIFRKIPKSKGRAFTVKAFSEIPKVQKAFAYIPEEEMETLNLEYYAKLAEENLDAISHRAFLTKAFSYDNEEDN